MLEDRQCAGLEGLVGDLACVIINVEHDRHRSAVEELQRYTGMTLTKAHRGKKYVTSVLTLTSKNGDASPFSVCGGTRRDGLAENREVSPFLLHATLPADVLIRSRLLPGNPFLAMNERPRSRHLPNTRLETFVFECVDLEQYVAIQKSRGVRFVTDEIVRVDAYSFIQTLPSPRLGASYGFIQFNDGRKYRFAGSEEIDWGIAPPAQAYRRNIGRLDHVATRLLAMDRDAAILELMRLTNHRYEFSIYVESLNSITNVTRRSRGGVGLVLTSGIAPFMDESSAGPTEKFVYNYGPRTHHMAFDTADIEETYAALGRDGMTFMVELVGGPSEGLHQTFTNPSPNTMIVNEYIHRYAGFDGYFTLSNVTALTAATGRQ